MTQPVPQPRRGRRVVIAGAIAGAALTGLCQALPPEWQHVCHAIVNFLTLGFGP